MNMNAYCLLNRGNIAGWRAQGETLGYKLSTVPVFSDDFLNSIFLFRLRTYSAWSIDAVLCR